MTSWVELDVDFETQPIWGYNTLLKHKFVSMTLSERKL